MSNPNDEVFSLVAKKMLEPVVDGEALDLFRVRILARPIAGGGAVQLFLFKDLPGQMVQEVEAWLPLLVDNGRGIYEAQLYHEARKNDSFGTLRFTYQGDAQHNSPDVSRFWETISQPHWTGPTSMMVIHPAKSSMPLNLSGLAGALSSQPQRPSTPGDGSASKAAAPASDVEHRRYENELFRNSLLSDVRASTQQAVSQVTQQLQQTQRPQPPAEDGVMKVAALALPFLKEFMADSRQARERAEERQSALLAEIRKKPETDPVIQALVQKAISEKPNEQMTSMLTVMGQGMSAMTQQVMQMLTFQMEMRQQMQPQDNGGLTELIGKAIDAWSITMEKVGSNAQAAGEEAAALPAGEDEPMEVDPIIAVEMAVRQQRSAQEVGDMLVAAMANAEFRAQLAAHKNDVREFVKARFGAWIAQDPEKRIAYVSSVLPQAVQYAIGKGAFARAPAAAQKVHQAAPPPPRAKEAAAPPAAARPEEPHTPQVVVVPLEPEKRNGRSKRQVKIQDVVTTPEANEAPTEPPPASA